ncbi:hypothetical protein [Streptomyces halstedii]|uniref:Uncharacterized protein n=1 Tax=Streptomyces halstedii TaxID=1944 RepID=A0A6N9UAS2_STRHA|nr:hypothetical protein [Streptomyces halstedii]NEA19759.1 hypothetical protein [Streptomyces halstedii]
MSERESQVLSEAALSLTDFEGSRSELTSMSFGTVVGTGSEPTGTHFESSDGFAKIRDDLRGDVDGALEFSCILNRDVTHPARPWAARRPDE